MKSNISKILIVNRGEIAVRVIQTCKKLGLRTVSVYSESDRKGPWVSLADEAFGLGGFSAEETYLNSTKIIEIAKRAKADSIHPGYGFLSENWEFAKLCLDNQLNFIGPSFESIKKMGSKVEAKRIATKCNVPIIPGFTDYKDFDDFLSKAKLLGFPVLLKAAAGGGGRGMRISRSPNDLRTLYNEAESEAKSSFGDPTLLAEKYFSKLRHIEVQVLGDKHGNHVTLLDRECSIQRRYQKLIEEAPAQIPQEIKNRLYQASIQLCKEMNYESLGTVEFVLDEELNFYFLEMNTRIQVEHPVTEQITGIDLVEEQIRVVQGMKLRPELFNINPLGFSIEARIYAENPDKNFMPSLGEILLWEPKTQWGARYDNGIESHLMVESHFDSLLSKVIVFGTSRREAITKLEGSLRNTICLGIDTNIDRLVDIIRSSEFANNNIFTSWLESTHFKKIEIPSSELIAATLNYILYLQKSSPLGYLPIQWSQNSRRTQTLSWEYDSRQFEVQLSSLDNKSNLFTLGLNKKSFKVQIISNSHPLLFLEIDGQHFQFTSILNTENKIWIHGPNGHFQFNLANKISQNLAKKESRDHYYSPCPGRIKNLFVNPGTRVNVGDPIFSVESMKVETVLKAKANLVVREIFFKMGSSVSSGDLIVKCEEIDV